MLGIKAMTAELSGSNAFGSDPAGGAEGGDFFVGKDAAADEEAEAFGVFEGEHAAAAGDYVEDELGVLPVFELGLADVEGGSVSLFPSAVLEGPGEMRGPSLRSG